VSASTLEGLGEVATNVRRRTIPFDIAFRFTLDGVPNKEHRRVVVISVEATFVAQSVGYGLVPEAPPITFGPPQPPRGQITLANLAFSQVIRGLATKLNDTGGRRRIGASVASILRNGVRLNPAFATLTLDSFGGRRGLDDSARANLFEAVAAPADRVQFLYAFFDDATGREFQSEPILNIAGLGIADGDRPFRYFARPIIFRPQSTIRLEITEKTTFRGELHVSLQGYKVLGGAGTPTGRAVQRAARRAGLGVGRRARRR
jgi:hypothetical protein